MKFHHGKVCSLSKTAIDSTDFSVIKKLVANHSISDNEQCSYKVHYRCNVSIQAGAFPWYAASIIQLQTHPWEILIWCDCGRSMSIQAGTYPWNILVLWQICVDPEMGRCVGQIAGVFLALHLKNRPTHSTNGFITIFICDIEMYLTRHVGYP